MSVPCLVISLGETEAMTHDADPDQEPVVQLPEPPQEIHRNLASILLHDLNTVAVTTVSAIAGAYTAKKILGGGRDDKGNDGGDHGSKAHPGS